MEISMRSTHYIIANRSSWFDRRRFESQSVGPRLGRDSSGGVGNRLIDMVSIVREITHSLAGFGSNFGRWPSLGHSERGHGLVFKLVSIPNATNYDIGLNFFGEPECLRPVLRQSLATAFRRRRRTCSA